MQTNAQQRRLGRTLPVEPLRGDHVLRARSRIAQSAGQLISNLTKHAHGERDMTQSQVKATQVLLAKVLPDMTSSEVTVHDPAASMTEAQLLDALARALSGAPQEVRMAVLGAITGNTLAGVEGRTIEHKTADSAKPAETAAETAEVAETVVPRPPLLP